MSILIVDDSRFNLNMLYAMLEEKGYGELYAAHSIEETFSFLGMGNPSDTPSYLDTPIDLILMEVALPHIGGIEACKKIKSIDRFRDIPVILMTENTEMETLERAFKAGAMDFIHRPFSEVELSVRIDSALKLKREMDVRKEREKELLTVMRELADANQKLKRLTLLDDLTGIANRRYFDAFSRQEWRRCLREKKPVSLIMLDIDYFKRYNDHYGHQKGDDCLKLVARTLNDTLNRAGDLAVRYGGEEFAVILSNTEPDGAGLVAHSIRKCIEDLRLVHPLSPISRTVTISLGVACCIPAADATFEQLIQAADQALYRAKIKGKNCVEVSSYSNCEYYA